LVDANDRERFAEAKEELDVSECCSVSLLNNAHGLYWKLL
jgi:hypothetical protein